MPTQIADSAVSGIPLDLSTGTGMSGVMTDFLSLFEQVVERGVSAQVSGRTALEGLIGIPDVSAGTERLVAAQPSSEWSGEKDAVERSMGPAGALLMAILGPPSQRTSLAPSHGPDRIADLPSSDAITIPVVGPSWRATTPSPFTLEADTTPNPADIYAGDPAAVTLPSDQSATVPIEIDPRLTPSVISQEVRASIVTPGPARPLQGLRVTTSPADAETHVAGADSAPMGMPVEGEDSRVAVVIASDQRERGNLIVKSPLAPLLKRGVGGISVAALPRNDGGEGDFLTNDLHVTGQPTGPFRGAQGVVSNNQTEIRSHVDPIEYLALPGPAARASSALFAQRTGVTAGSAADLQDLAHVADPAAAIPVKSRSLLQSQAADGTTASGRRVLFERVLSEDDAAMHLKGDIPREGAMPDVEPGPVSLSPGPQRTAVRASAEPSVTVQPSLFVPQGSSRKTPAADAEAITSPVNDGPTGTTVSTLLTTSAGEGQDGTGRSGRGQLTEQVADPLQLRVSVEGRTGAIVAPSPTMSDRSRLTQRSTVPIGESSDRSELIGWGIAESGRWPEQIQVERMDGDRDAMGQGRPNPENVQNLQQDRSASSSEDADRFSERSSSPPGDGRQFGADLACAAAPRGESLRPDVSGPSIRPRVIVDQVAEQIATAARISLRQEGESVQLRLHPQALGEVVIEVSWKDSGIIAAIKAQSHAASELLSADLGRLRIALEEHGIPVSDLGVQVGLDLRQWSYAGNGSHPSPAIGYAAGTIPWHDRRSVLSVVPAIGPDSVIDITV